MSTVTVDLGERSYPIIIDTDIISRTEIYRDHIVGRNVLIVCDDNTRQHYLQPLLECLNEFNTGTVCLPAGEANKNLDTVNLIFDELLKQNFDRNCTLIALGGGVVGDICGFAAAAYQRGVAFIQVPTTLLAQVDSSVGGKTGVNHALGKNMIGAFHQPKCVIADMDTLQTLPDREFRAGLAEVIKYGLIDDIDFFSWVQRELHQLLDLNSDALSEAVRRSCENKARIVAADELEQGQRALLNLGHTFGHAIETATGYGVWLHGEAIAAGMCMAARFSAYHGYMDSNNVRVIEAIFSDAGLPIQPPPNMTATQCYALMRRDKKVRDDVLTLVLMKNIGESFLSKGHEHNRLSSFLQECFSKE